VTERNSQKNQATIYTAHRFLLQMPAHNLFKKIVRKASFEHCLIYIMADVHSKGNKAINEIMNDHRVMVFFLIA
jgi:hypothetical protein